MLFLFRLLELHSKVVVHVFITQTVCMCSVVHPPCSDHFSLVMYINFQTKMTSGLWGGSRKEKIFPVFVFLNVILKEQKMLKNLFTEVIEFKSVHSLVSGMLSRPSFLEQISVVWLFFSAPTGISLNVLTFRNAKQLIAF